MNLKRRAGLALLGSYGLYVGYIQVSTSQEINRRAFEAMTLPSTGDSAQSPEKRYKSLVVAGKFANPFPQYRSQTLFEFAYRRISELFHSRPRGGVPLTLEEVHNVLPSHAPDLKLLNETSTATRLSFGELLKSIKSHNGLPAIENRITFTWIGQSCAYIQLPGLNILTDPCFDDHLVSRTFGPQRISPPPCDVTELPRIDLVLVSHDHPDHLDLVAAEKIGNGALWVVPLGVGHHLAKVGVTNIIEMDWWQRANVETKPKTITDQSIKSTTAGDSEYDVVCTPAMHWSGRALVDSNHTLWASFMVLKHGKPVFFHAGDTGYSPELFQGIAKFFGQGPKVAMLPCGAYTPSWHLRPQHMDPREALQAMKDIEAEKMVGVHWGTFVMSDEHFLEPRDKLHDLAIEDGLKNDVIAPAFGRTLVFRLDKPSKGRMISVHNGDSILLD